MWTRAVALCRGPDSTAGRETTPGRRASERELRTETSCLWVGEPSHQRGNSPAGKLFVLVCAGIPLPGSSSGQGGSYLCWPHVSIYGLEGLQRLCGPFHVEPTQILTGKVRVEIKPSEPNSRLPPLWCSCQKPPLSALLPGLWATRPEKVAEVFQSCSPGSSASWCNEKLLFPLILYRSGLETETQGNTGTGGERVEGDGTRVQQSHAPLGSSPRCWQHSFLWGEGKFCKKMQTVMNKITTDKNIVASISSKEEKQKKTLDGSHSYKAKQGAPCG